MTLRDRAQPSAAAVVAATEVDWCGLTLGRPSRFVAKPDPVRAIWHDGNNTQVAVVVEWLQQAGDRQVTVEAEPGAVVVIRQAWRAKPVRLRPGALLVQNAAGWTGYSTEQFQAAFQPHPRELPIFDYGEVA